MTTVSVNPPRYPAISPTDHPDDRGDADRHETDRQRASAAIEHARENISPKIIGAHQMLAAGSLADRLRVLLDRIVGRQLASENRDDDDRQQHDEPGNGARVLAQSPQRIPGQTRRFGRRAEMVPSPWESDCISLASMAAEVMAEPGSVIADTWIEEAVGEVDHQTDRQIDQAVTSTVPWMRG